MNPKSIVSDEDAELLRQARARRDATITAAKEEFRAVVMDVETRSSIRETAKSARLSPDTISRWKRGD